MRIDIWSDIACPWCYIGLTRFRQALDGFAHADEVTVTLRSFQLDPSLPESFEGSEVDYLTQSKGMPRDTVTQMIRQVATVAAEAGLDFQFDALKVANSRRAHRLLQAAGAAGVAEELELALFRAHFTDGESISETDVLVRHGVAAGLSEEAARAALDSTELDAAVSADIEEAAALGIRGVPFFVLAGKYGISGAQPLEAFTQTLDQVWAETHPSLVSVSEAGQSCGPQGCD